MVLAGRRPRPWPPTEVGRIRLADRASVPRRLHVSTRGGWRASSVDGMRSERLDELGALEARREASLMSCPRWPVTSTRTASRPLLPGPRARRHRNGAARRGGPAGGEARRVRDRDRPRACRRPGLGPAGADRVRARCRAGRAGAMGGGARRVAAAERPWALLFEATRDGRAVAAAVAARCGWGLTGDAIGLEISPDGRLVAWKPAFGGQLVAPIEIPSPVQMATVRPGIMRRRTPRP